MRRQTALYALICVLLGLFAAVAHSETPDPWKKHISLHMKEISLTTAIGMLLNGSGINYTVDPKVGRLQVNARMEDIPLDAALKELLDATGAVSSESNGVVHISTVDSGTLWQLERQLADLTAKLGAEKQSKTEKSPDVIAIRGSIKEVEDRIKEEKRQQQSRISAAGSQTPPSPPKGTVVAVVKLKYADPGLVAEQAFDLGLYKVVTSVGRKLILMGRPEIVRQAKNLIAQLDDESSQSRSVRLSIVAKATRTRPDGRSVDSTLSTKASGVFGGRWSSYIDLQDHPINLSLELFSATPSPDGRIITISGKGRLIYSNPPGMPMDMPMLFETSLQNGVPKSIGSTATDSDGYATRADVTVTATIDPVRLQSATTFGRTRR